ncbi:MAG: ABC-type multidrug transport system fused ATPase/permease subunit [Myxococcota bacterium]
MLGRLQDVVGAPRSVAVPNGEGPPGAVHIADAGTADDTGAVLLTDVHLDVRPGELVAVVGEVGAGKTLLLELLAGARPLSAGDLSRPPRHDVGHVAQDPLLLSTTLRENILLGREVSDDALAMALEVSRLAQDLPTLSHGLDTAVGERGVTLSGGQQQRVALARALVGRPSVLLLDDATAALDADTEAAFWAELERVLPDVAAVVVTHRRATLERADQVVVLEGGAVVQRGRHADLIASEGSYRRIYGRYQALDALA